MKYYNLFTNDPLFKQREFNSLDEERRITTLRIHKILQLKLLTDEELLTNPYSVSNKTEQFPFPNMLIIGLFSYQILSRIVAEFHYCPSTAVKFGLTFVMFRNVLFTLGNEDQLDTFFACERGEVCQSFYYLV